MKKPFPKFQKASNIAIAIAAEKPGRQDVADVWRCKDFLEKVLPKLGFAPKTCRITKSDLNHEAHLSAKLTGLNPLCVFNLFEGFDHDYLAEAKFAAIMEKNGLSFTGNPAQALALCADKYQKKMILEQNGISVPQRILVQNQNLGDSGRLNFPLFIKCRYESASVGIDQLSLVDNHHDLLKALKIKLAKFPQGLMVEEFIPGKEYAASFWAAAPEQFLGISVLDYAQYPDCPPFLSYDSKWKASCLAFKKLNPKNARNLEHKLKEEIIEISLRAAAALGCQSYFRIDLREKNGRLFILDVNPNPDLNQDAGFMRQAAWQGLSYEAVIQKIVDSAFCRGAIFCAR